MNLPLNGQPFEQPHRPNSIHFGHGTTNFSEHFGVLYSVSPHNLTGDDHDPTIQVRFCYGLRLDFAPGAFRDMLREGERALAQLPFIPDDIHDAVVGGDE